MSSSAHFVDPNSFHRQSDEFMAWLAHKPGVKISPKIQLADLRSTDAGRGVVSRCDIPEGEELFAIPRDLVLTPHNSKLNSLLSQELGELGPWLSLILVMIYEFLQGDKSTWAPYFMVLPREFDTLMFWSDEELKELQGSAIIDRIGKQGAEESILEMIAPIVRENPSLFPPVDGLSSYEGNGGTKTLLSLAHMMGSLIMAYAFDIEKPEDEDGEGDDESGYMTDEEEQLPKGMVPLADLLNADAHRNNVSFEHILSECSALPRGRLLGHEAIKPIKEGDEIFNDYGEIPRSDLLRRYGYVTDSYAPYDVVELPLDAICEAAGLESADIESQPALHFLEDFELLDDGYAIPRPSPEDSLSDILPDELLLLLKTLAFSPEQLKQQKSKNKPPKPSLGQAEAAILSKAVQLKQSQYATTISQDQEHLAKLGQLVASERSSRRRKMATQVRIGEKEVLHKLSSMLDGFMTNGEGSTLKRNANNDGRDSRRTKAQKS
ncbi:SET domain-containing protein [Aspergillus sclerotialis]|uniref:Ribosomal lysine N-methyltransferase 4 n=1 Tax=Aspergillus sclerotialis TaxID=2070753 RepID=A0A3A2ZYX8_9EURO|nr:SET domain-containing protein [Aspergillus sclerotialis]